MTKDEVLTKLNKACSQFYERHYDLIQMKANERTISPKIASLMESLFSGYDIDSEPN